MAQWKKRFLPMALSCLCSMQGSVCLFGNDSSLKRQSTWNWPESQSVISKFEDFLGTMPNRSNMPAIKNRLADLSSLRGVTMLESVVALAAECEPSIAKLRELLSGNVSAQTVPDIDAALSSMMANGGIPSWMKSDVQLLACRVMVQNSLYDEALQRLKLIAVDQVSDPSTYLFYTAFANTICSVVRSASKIFRDCWSERWSCRPDTPSRLDSWRLIFSLERGFARRDLSTDERRRTTTCTRTDRQASSRQTTNDRRQAG